MKQLNPRELCKMLRKNGYNSERTNGSHQIWSNGIISIPVPIVNLNFKVALKIAKQCGLAIR